jgi:hypothetical protein
MSRLPDFGIRSQQLQVIGVLAAPPSSCRNLSLPFPDGQGGVLGPQHFMNKEGVQHQRVSQEFDEKKPVLSTWPGFRRNLKTCGCRGIVRNGRNGAYR